ETPSRRPAGTAELDSALDRVLRAENAHFTLIWDQASRVQRAVPQALAAEPLVSATSEDFRHRHGLPGGSSVQRALDALIEDESVLRESAGAYRIAEPFLAEWILRLGRSPRGRGPSLRCRAETTVCRPDEQ